MLSNNYLAYKKKRVGPFFFGLLSDTVILPSPPPLSTSQLLMVGVGGGEGGSMFSLEQRPAEDRVNLTHILYTAHL